VAPLHAGLSYNAAFASAPIPSRIRQNQPDMNAEFFADGLSKLFPERDFQVKEIEFFENMN
jgi:hypothetical protein